MIIFSTSSIKVYIYFLPYLSPLPLYPSTLLPFYPSTLLPFYPSNLLPLYPSKSSTSQLFFLTVYRPTPLLRCSSVLPFNFTSPLITLIPLIPLITSSTPYTPHNPNPPHPPTPLISLSFPSSSTRIPRPSAQQITMETSTSRSSMTCVRLPRSAA